MNLVLTGASGWVLVLLLPLTIALPFVLRRRTRRTADEGPAGGRWRLHYWLGYGIAALAAAHAVVPTSTGLALRANAAGLYLATAALLLVFIQVFVGLLLREPSLRNRPVMRRWHFWGMAGIVVLALGHIALNSVLLHGAPK